jgi:hypothetical protein
LISIRHGCGVAEINNCTGSQRIGGRHAQIRHLPHRRTHHQLSRSDYLTYDGNVASWFQDLVTLVQPQTPHPHGCWRVKDTERLCTGERQDFLNIVVSLPVMLVIEVGDENMFGSTVANANDMIWNFRLGWTCPHTSFDIYCTLCRTLYLGKPRGCQNLHLQWHVTWRFCVRRA